jgi:hypothetical protein
VIGRIPLEKIVLEPILHGEIIKLKKDGSPHIEEKTCRLVSINKGIFLLKDLTEEKILEARPEEINWEEYRQRS